MDSNRLLISYAHPDDESFGLGGLIAKYVEQGVEVYLLCATNGEVGTVDEKFLAGYSSVAEVRLAELARASEILKFSQVFTLGYRDSGMIGTPDNDHADALWHQWHTQPAAVMRRVVEVIRQVRPQVIITFNEYGGYGHPDHIAIQQATVKAMECVNDPSYVTEGYAPFQPSKLYYSGVPKFPLQLGITLSRLRGEDPRHMGRNKDIDLVKILDHVDVPTASIDIGDYYEIWDAASACHASQGGGRTFWGLPKWARRFFFGTQKFTLVIPKPAANAVLETDLFAGVPVKEAVAI
ncbi:MAG: PIG-L family deacetylase [Phototrophicaceae bacterium]|jgi:LmbE family N-acetylglucosaminyl deacetylase